MVNSRLLLLLILLGFSGYSKAMEGDDDSCYGDSHLYICMGAPVTQQPANADPDVRYFQIHNLMDHDLYVRLVVGPQTDNLGRIESNDFREIGRPTYRFGRVELFMDPEYQNKFGLYPISLDEWRLSGLRRLVIYQSESGVYVQYEHDFRGRQCPICWDQIQAQTDEGGQLVQNVWILGCGHVFHCTCLAGATGGCPICRAPIGRAIRHGGAGVSRAAISATVFDLVQNIFCRK